MLISACVVLDLGTVPNCCRSILLSTAGFTDASTTYSFTTFESIGVNEIGRRCLFTSSMGLCLGTGTLHPLLSTKMEDGLPDMSS